jgi:hypothetical protein
MNKKNDVNFPISKIEKYFKLFLFWPFLVLNMSLEFSKMFFKSQG